MGQWNNDTIQYVLIIDLNEMLIVSEFFRQSLFHMIEVV